jgi:hypothetical protein
LLRHHPELTHRIPLGEEISFHFDGYLFHLGITGYSAREIAPLHAALQQAASANRLDDLFEMLHATECLVVFNHPLVPWGEERGRRIPAEDLLRRYGFAIHALEFNGMRSREENERVLELAKHTGKPVIGGGDSHLLMASSVLTLTQAPDYNQFAAEVKEGRAVPLITPAFFAPLGWKLFLRVLFFMGHYRRIGHFRGQPVSDLLRGRTVGLDPIGYASRLFLQLAGALGVVR